MNMTIKVVFGFFVAGMASVWAAPPSITSAVTPGTMSYQGRLQTPEGADYVNGIYTVEFRLYDTANETNMLWGATYKPYVNNGFFSVILGQTNVGETPLAGAEFSDVEDFWKGVWIDPNSAKKNRYLGITVLEGADNALLASPAESFPRQELLASPFAIQSQFAQQAVHSDTADASLSDFTINGSLQTDGSALVLESDLDVTGELSSSSGSLILNDEVQITGNILDPFGSIELYDNVNITGGLAVQGSIYSRDGLNMNGHSMSHVVEAPASGVRMVAGIVNLDGTEYRDVGNQYTVAKITTGWYRIIFTTSFANDPVVVVTGGLDSNATENFYSIKFLSAGFFDVESRDDSPSGTAAVQDAGFHFIVIGQ